MKVFAGIWLALLFSVHPFAQEHWDWSERWRGRLQDGSGQTRGLIHWLGMHPGAQAMGFFDLPILDTVRDPGGSMYGYKRVWVGYIGGFWADGSAYGVQGNVWVDRWVGRNYHEWVPFYLLIEFEFVRAGGMAFIDVRFQDDDSNLDSWSRLAGWLINLEA